MQFTKFCCGGNWATTSRNPGPPSTCLTILSYVNCSPIYYPIIYYTPICHPQICYPMSSGPRFRRLSDSNAWANRISHEYLLICLWAHGGQNHGLLWVLQRRGGLVTIRAEIHHPHQRPRRTRRPMSDPVSRFWNTRSSSIPDISNPTQEANQMFRETPSEPVGNNTQSNNPVYERIDDNRQIVMMISNVWWRRARRFNGAKFPENLSNVEMRRLRVHEISEKLSLYFNKDWKSWLFPGMCLFSEIVTFFT